MDGTRQFNASRSHDCCHVQFCYYLYGTYSDVEAFVSFKSKKVSLSFQMARVYTNE